jgi:acetyl esterase/lipase
MVDRDIPYIRSTEPFVMPDPKNLLDVYYEKNMQAKPVVVYIHGGAWSQGDKLLFVNLGETLVSMGCVGVIINYRLSPAVTHPTHVEDCAAAIDWVRRNIVKYGGNPDNIFLCGHSAGAHLVALLALDSKYLQQYASTPGFINGVIALAGVYRLYKIGSQPVPPFFADIFSIAFGDDMETRQDASPVNHIRKDAPPFLVMFGENENRFMKRQSIDFFEELVDKGADGEIREIPQLDHVSIVTDIWEKDSELAEIIENFIGREL